MAGPDIDYDNIVQRLVEDVPDLKRLYDEHIREYDELLHHVFFGDLTRYVMDSFQCCSSELAEHGQAGREGAASALGILEEGIASSDPRVQELVSVSFLENLDQDNKGYTAIRSALGPNLRRELEEYE